MSQKDENKSKSLDKNTTEGLISGIDEIVTHSEDVERLQKFLMLPKFDDRIKIPPRVKVTVESLCDMKLKLVNQLSEQLEKIIEELAKSARPAKTDNK